MSAKEEIEEQLKLQRAAAQAKRLQTTSAQPLQKLTTSQATLPAKLDGNTEILPGGNYYLGNQEAYMYISTKSRMLSPTPTCTFLFCFSVTLTLATKLLNGIPMTPKPDQTFVFKGPGGQSHPLSSLSPGKTAEILTYMKLKLLKILNMLLSASIIVNWF